jgi:hypothetical protein
VRRLYRKLARGWGYSSVEAYLAGRSSSQLTEDIAEYRLEPFGDLRGDMQAAVVAGAAANSFGSSGLSGADFLLSFDDEGTGEQTEEEQIAELQALTAQWERNHPD